MSAEILALQAVSDVRATADAGALCPMPPTGLPALRPIPGSGIEGASVLGYFTKSAVVGDCIAPNGRLTVPGEPGYYEAQMGRLGVDVMPPGWVFKSRNCIKLYGLVKGNPILLEDSARAAGYARAVAAGPNTLDLGEIEI